MDLRGICDLGPLEAWVRGLILMPEARDTGLKSWRASLPLYLPAHLHVLSILTLPDMTV